MYSGTEGKSTFRERDVQREGCGQGGAGGSAGGRQSMGARLSHPTSFRDFSRLEGM